MSDQNQEDKQINHIKGAIEALLFTNERPISLDQIKKALETVAPGEIKEAIASLQDDYDQRQSGINIVEIAGGYQMLSHSNYAVYIRNFYKTKHKEKLSKPALEAMAIIAYKQPVTRADVEAIRGVNSDGVVAHLLEKELIKVVGRREVAGRPFEYGTTKQFMEYFGLRSLDDLPNLEEFPSLQPDAENDATVIDELTGEPLSSIELQKRKAIRESERLAEQARELEETGKASQSEQQDSTNQEDLSQDDVEETKDELGQLEEANATISKAEQFLEEADKEG